jgi:hypothetical protein
VTGVGQFRPIISSNLAAHPLFKTLAAHSSVGKVNDQFRLAFPRERLGGELSFLPGGEVPKLLPNVAAHDPVVAVVVRNNVNGGGCHRLSSMRSELSGDREQRRDGDQLFALEKNREKKIERI